MIEERYVVTYDDAPKSLNAGGAGSRRHWGAAHREKMKWEGVFAVLLLAAKVPKHMSFCNIDVVIRFRHRHHRDSENYRSPVSKPLADALVKGGWLKDDTDEHFRLRDFGLEVGEIDHRDPRVKSQMVITLDAQYE